MHRLAPLSLLVAGLGSAVALGGLAVAGQVSTQNGKRCPTATFPNLAVVSGAGASYAKPRVKATCSNTQLIVTSNGMIGYRFVPKTPNALAEQDWTWTVTRTPKVATKPTSIRNVLGTLGFTVTGLPIYGPTEGPVPANEAFGDPVYNGILDSCGGHTGPGAEYHNHALHSVLACNLKPGAVVGYALDGFPIYGPTGCLNTSCTRAATMRSGYVKTGNPKANSWNAYAYRATGATNVLDKCNGRIEPDGSYGYHATFAFPYIIGCFTGTPNRQTGNARAPMPPM